MKKFNTKRTLAIALLCFAMSALLVVGGVYAYLKLESLSVENEFDPDASETPEISETVSETVKSDVSVNIGDTGYTAFVRVAVVINWKHTDPITGDVSVYPIAPKKGTDYTLTLNEGDEKDWFIASDGFYYHRDPVESSGNTKVLIENLTVTNTAPQAGYVLSVDIITQTIQAAGSADGSGIPAAEDAWKVVTVESGQLKKK